MRLGRAGLRSGWLCSTAFPYVWLACGDPGMKGALCPIWGHQAGVWLGEEHVSCQMGSTSGFL